MANSNVRDNRLTTEAPIIGVSGDRSSLLYNQGVNVGQGGELTAGNKIGTADNVTINSGVQPDVLQNLVGSLTTATKDQLSSVTQANADQLQKLTEALTAKNDQQDPNQKLLYFAGAALAGLALLIFFRD